MQLAFQYSFFCAMQIGRHNAGLRLEQDVPALFRVPYEPKGGCVDVFAFAGTPTPEMRIMKVLPWFGKTNWVFSRGLRSNKAAYADGQNPFISGSFCSHHVGNALGHLPIVSVDALRQWQVYPPRPKKFIKKSMLRGKHHHTCKGTPHVEQGYSTRIYCWRRLMVCPGLGFCMLLAAIHGDFDATL